MVDKLNIERLVFAAGSNPGAEPLKLDLPNVTVLVGPNNSGKSQTLREIEAKCLGSNEQPKVVADVQIRWPDTEDDLMSMLGSLETEAPQNQTTQADYMWVGRPTIRSDERSAHYQFSVPDMKRIFADKSNLTWLCSNFVRLYTLRIDGRTRFDLVAPKKTGKLEAHPQNHLWALFTDDDAREKVRDFTDDAFGRYFVIDPTGMSEFRVRLSDVKPTKEIEQGLQKSSRDFHNSAQLVTELGDGVQSSVGLVSAVMSLPHKILLIDEPEAFLHPTLARLVGRTLSKTARDRDASLIVSTHSADFLMGCIQSAPELRIVRLTYLNGQATARSVPPAEITTLMQDPLLRSTNALRALFHRGVIVSEADADRAFYEEINTRLQSSSRGTEDALFLNAQNWQTIPRVAAPLRKLGIPAAAIFDFDVLLEPSWNQIWNLVVSTPEEITKLQSLRGQVLPIVQAVGRSACKKNGLAAIPAANRVTVRKFVDQLAEHGVFIVPVGELECWLANLGVARTNNKPLWLNNIFQALGSDPNSTDYINASTGDVWDFVDEIERWVTNPVRKGLPV